MGGRGVAFYQLWPSDHGSRGADARARRMGGDGLACHVRRAVGCVAGAAAISAWGLPPARVRVPCAPSVSPCAMVAAFNAVTRSRGCPAPSHARTRLPCRHGEPVVPKRHARGDGCPWAGAARGGWSRLRVPRLSTLLLPITVRAGPPVTEPPPNRHRTFARNRPFTCGYHRTTENAPALLITRIATPLPTTTLY